MNRRPTPAARPLNGFARLLLLATTAATIALFYVFISVSLGLLLLWIGLILAVCLALARFGLAGLMMKFAQRDIRLLGMVGRSLWLREGAVYRLPLQPADAPRLFEMIQRLAARLGIPPPDEVCLEMSSGAWVELRGLKTGLGVTRVGVGYDLLASLSEREVEAVMAHELAHAKLIGRVFRNWLFAGFQRAARVSSQLSATADAYRRARDSFGVGDWMLVGADGLTRLCARQMGAYSRQNEFEADRGAAELCGTAPMRSSLLRLEAVQPRLNRLPWNERRAQIEAPEGLSAWLRQELAGADPVVADKPAVFDRYSTHPALHDRLAALPDDGSTLAASGSGLALLAAPDAIALKLVGAIEQTALQEEKKDLAGLRKWLRSARRGGSIHLAQVPGVLLLLGGGVTGLAALAYGYWLFSLILLGVGLPLGVWLYRLGYYRDRRALPVPEFNAFMIARQDFPLPDAEAREKTIEAELRALVAGEPKDRRKGARLVDEAYAALGRADYLRAHVAARVAANFDPKSVERQLAMLVAAAAFSQGDTVNQLIKAVLKATGLRSPSTLWATAWALTLGGDWMQAEALLHETMKGRGNDPTLLAILAVCQARRGKLQSAIANLNRCCQPKAPSERHLKHLVGQLLDRGALREADARLAQFGPASAYDPEVIHLRIQLHLLRREFAAADAQLAHLAESELTGPRLLAFGHLYENARNDAKAADFFQRVLATGHYPAAQLALARQAAAAKDYAKARTHIHAALDTTKPAAKKAATAPDILPQALVLLYNLKEPVASCRAWLARFQANKDAGLLTKRTLLIFAPTEAEALHDLQELLQVLKPGVPPLAPAFILVTPAPGDLQPARPVRPGVQYLYR